MSSYVKDLSKYAVTRSGDHYAKNIIQVARSNGTEPVTLRHSFYGISDVDEVYPLASMDVTESATGSKVADLCFNVVNEEGVETPVLQVGATGMTVSGEVSVTGGAMKFETAVLEVADKDVVLASSAITAADIDGGGIIVGTEESGEVSFVYSGAGDTWAASVGVNVPSAGAFTVGDDDVRLDAEGLTIGDVRLSPGSLRLSDDVVLDGDGLTVGEVVLSALNGLSIGEDLSVTSATGLTIGSDNKTILDATSLALGDDVLLNHDGLHLSSEEAAVYMGGDKWKIAFDSVSQNIVFQFYDEVLDSYVTKLEIKNGG